MSDNKENKNLNITEQELLELLREIEQNSLTRTPPPTVQPSFAVPTEETVTEPAPETYTRPLPKTPTVPIERIKKAFWGIIPRKGDPVSEIVRKSVFLVSLAAFIVSIGVLFHYMIAEPQAVKNEQAEYVDVFYNPPENRNPANYPTGMRSQFYGLYDINKDVAGWLKYISTDANGFLSINQPVVHTDNNDTYLTRGFDGKRSRSGTLFLDESNKVGIGATNRVNIIYGHNMASGLMFAHLNKMVTRIHYARSAPTFTYSTLYQDYTYKVFAVVVADEGADPERYYGYLRTAFADDADFMNYLNELRARSLYDYPVDVRANDELMILSTCTNKSQVKVDDGRTAIIARRVRDGEEETVNTSAIVPNEDVIMPYTWYTAQNLTPHVFYTQTDYHVPEDSTVTTVSKATAATAKTTLSSTTATTTTGNTTTSATATDSGTTTMTGDTTTAQTTNETTTTATTTTIGEGTTTP